MAIASRGFFREADVLSGVSVDGVIGLAEPLKILVFVFVNSFLLARIFRCVEFAHVEHRFRHDVFLRGPVAKIAIAAALATKGKILVRYRISGLFTNWAAMFHRKRLPTASDLPLAKSRCRYFFFSVNSAHSAISV